MMDAGDVADSFLTHERRLASFSATQKKRASNNGARAMKTPQWPHKTLSPETLAKAGFFFFPSAENPDNVACFLCHKSLAGWEETDRPWEEHLRHSPDCGWAVAMAIEAGDEAVLHADPKSADMVAARKTTFSSRWPYEKKRGWKCKTKQLVDAGWIYCPTEESDDMAICPYCGLGLSGWEASDNPWDEHYKRKSDCIFFALVTQYQTSKKGGRGKGTRISKVSRLSVQSTTTVASVSEVPSMSELTVEVDDSMMTTNASVITTTAAAGPSKKAGRGRKVAAAKGRKPRTKKGEVAEQTTDDNMLPPSPPPLPPLLSPLPAKTARGKKRTSDPMDDSVLAMDVPVAKRARTRGSDADGAEAQFEPVPELEPGPEIAVDELTASDEEMMETKISANARKQGVGKHGRSTSTISSASKASLRAPGAYPDEEDELMCQIQDDFDHESPEPTDRKSLLHAMFDTNPVSIDDDELEEELRKLQRTMAVDAESAVRAAKETKERAEADVEEVGLAVPKKGRKTGGTRKVSSKQTSKKGTTPETDLPRDEEYEHEHEQQYENENAIANTEPQPWQQTNEGEESLVRNASSTSIEIEHKGKKRGRPLKRPNSKSEVTTVESEAAAVEEPAPERLVGEKRAKPGVEPELIESEIPVLEEQIQSDAPVAPDAFEEFQEPLQPTDLRHDEEKMEDQNPVPESPSLIRQSAPQPEKENQDLTPARRTSRTPSPTKQARNPPSSIPRSVAMPSTPAKNKTIAPSPAPSARQPILSPSQSPQSSDAENQPPSARTAVPPPTTVKRVMLAPPAPAAAMTPVRSNASPTKFGRSVLRGGARTEGTPWQSVDIDAVFDTMEELGGEGGDDDDDDDDDDDYDEGYMGPESGDDPTRNDDETAMSSQRWKKVFIRSGELTSPERNMTVDEWIHNNARVAEGRLRLECEGLVSRFESEGGRAMRVLEGLVVEN